MFSLPSTYLSLYLVCLADLQVHIADMITQVHTNLRPPSLFPNYSGQLDLNRSCVNSPEGKLICCNTTYPQTYLFGVTFPIIRTMCSFINFPYICFSHIIATIQSQAILNFHISLQLSTILADLSATIKSQANLALYIYFSATILNNCRFISNNSTISQINHYIFLCNYSQ